MSVSFFKVVATSSLTLISILDNFIVNHAKALSDKILNVKKCFCFSVIITFID